ncbi:hypothetical protein [Mucilaginibacter aquatilis]|uniref:Uncharacterized protein n=1 Tax=Mucilaginibacter aquatilis TaxID=1517760 RepID=A0A6I4IBN7_9SPHI|nr:hypothetical protein [Mucilaginibacter aquatilis]MVN92670.1 hypothetical protein [Mucilaginibacter aquatilis]
MYLSSDSSDGSGVYILNRPDSSSFVEILELRPDMLVCWTQVPDPDDPSPEMDRRGNWLMTSLNTLSLFLLNEAETELYSFCFEYKDGILVEETNPNITLRKRPGFTIFQEPFYFDPR